MRTKTEIKKIEATPEVQIAQRLEASINAKLNHDGRWEMLNPVEAVLRLSHLTREESDFYGNLNGWLDPYYGGVDWDLVPERLLAEIVHQGQGLQPLQYLYPAPGLKPVIDAADPDDITAFLQGGLTLDQLKEKHSGATP